LAAGYRIGLGSSKNIQSLAKPRENLDGRNLPSGTVVEDADAYVQAAELNVGRGLRGLRADTAV
jgi:hypothetical protein